MYLARSGVFISRIRVLSILNPRFVLLSRRLNHTDSKHYFTDPKTNEIKKPPTFFQHHDSKVNASADDVAQAIAESVRAHKKRRQKVFFSAMLTGIIGVTLGFSISYKVLYKKQESFIPLVPSRKWHRLSAYDAQRVNIDEMKMLGKMRCLSVLTNHEMIREQFGIPLKTDTGEVPSVKSFEVWCEDQDPGVLGIVVRPIDATRDNDSRYHRTHGWHTIPGLFQWRMGTKPMKIRDKFDSFLKFIGVNTGDLLEVINPDREVGDFKYEYPLRKGDSFDGDDDRAMHIWFFGEIDLSQDAMVVFKGKYHVNVKLEQVDLLKKENDQLIRYVLYKNENDKKNG